MESLRKSWKYETGINATTADPDVQMSDIIRENVAFSLLVLLYLLMLTHITQKFCASILLKDYANLQSLVFVCRRVYEENTKLLCENVFVTFDIFINQCPSD